MRKIKWIVLHCADTEEGKDFSVVDIDRWHKQRGWAAVGYHFVITLNGNLQQGRTLDCVGAHCLHYNAESVGICYIGGRRQGQFCDTRTLAQRQTLERCVKDLLKRFPDAKVCGHHDLNPGKACPCFDVARWAEAIGLPERNIYRGGKEVLMR